MMANVMGSLHHVGGLLLQHVSAVGMHFFPSCCGQHSLPPLGRWSALLLGGLATSYGLCWARLLPDRALRSLFVFHLLISMTTANVGITILNLMRRLKLMPRQVAAGWCSAVTALAFRWSRWMSPHVRVQLVPGSLPSFSCFDTPNAVCLNHTSFMDTILYLWVVDVLYMRRMKTFYKWQLTKIPLLSNILVSSEMLPVYFVTDSASEFRVERDKQAKVLEDTEKHLAAGGSISFYPEGTINRGDLQKLHSFRVGSFHKILEHKLHLYFFLHVGCPRVWGPKEAVGGHAGTIFVYFGKIEGIDYNDPTLDAKKLSELAHAYMQHKLDVMHQYMKEVESKNK